jgi:4-hydroxy-tetrahydrodipicolinate synthase
MAERVSNLHGVYTALVTPFSSDGSHVDYDSLGHLIDFQLQSGVHGVVACGSTGESATMSEKEYVDVVRFVRERTKGKLPCIGGISVSSTSRAIEMARQLEELGCDAVLLAAPPYNKPTQAGLLEHCRAVYRAVRLPIIAYNIPGRSGVAFSSATLGALSREGTISGIKESSGSVDAIADTIALVDPKCQVVSGDDSLTLAVLAYGGTGVISAAANALPAEFVALTDAWKAGKANEARKEQMGILSKIRALFIESNPVPVKTVLALKGVIRHPAVRLPLVPLSPESLQKVKLEFGL